MCVASLQEKTNKKKKLQRNGFKSGKAGFVLKSSDLIKSRICGCIWKKQNAVHPFTSCSLVERQRCGKETWKGICSVQTCKLKQTVTYRVKVCYCCEGEPLLGIDSKRGNYAISCFILGLKLNQCVEISFHFEFFFFHQKKLNHTHC